MGRALDKQTRDGPGVNFYLKGWAGALMGIWFLFRKSSNILGPSQKVKPKPWLSLGHSQNVKPEPSKKNPGFRPGCDWALTHPYPQEQNTLRNSFLKTIVQNNGKMHKKIFHSWIVLFGKNYKIFSRSVVFSCNFFTNQSLFFFVYMLLCKH